MLLGVEPVPVPSLGGEPASDVVAVSGDPGDDRGRPCPVLEELGEVGVVALPVDRPPERGRVPVGVDRGQGGGPPLRACGVLA